MAGIVSYLSPMLGKLNGHGFSNSHGHVCLVYPHVSWFVGGFNHLEKYDFVNGKDYPIFCGK